MQLFRKKKFIDVGFLYGPSCPAYGFGSILFAIFLDELKSRPVFLFLGGTLLSIFVVLLTGFILERIFHRKWWDYSRKRFHFGGYVNLTYTVIWGLLAMACVLFINPFLCKMTVFIPLRIGQILLVIFYVVMVIDLIGTITGIAAVNSRINKLFVIEGMSENLQKAADFMGQGVAGWVLKHLGKAYPNLNLKEFLEARREHRQKIEAEKTGPGVFGAGCSFYKLSSIFFLGSFLGDIVETIFCYLTTGRLMSRSSVVYGPFSIVWGLGCAIATALLYQYRNRNDRYIFVCGMFMGGAYEYMCSIFTELVFGTVFWDYSKLPFNLGGRINLLFCLFWGIAAVIWMKILYPFLSRLIEKIPKRTGVVISWILIVFMVFDITVSGLALIRYSDRHSSKAADNAESGISTFLDEHFPDERMERIYPNAIIRN
ncbi:MAG: putative ABC transporter permease [Agathobacter sp.]